MSTVFGADTTLDEASVPERMAARLFSWWVPLLNGLFDDGAVRFDREQLRIGLHGKSEQPGDGYTRGMAVAALWFGNASLSALPLLLLGEVPVPESLAVQTLLLASLITSTALFYGVATGSVSLIFETELIDHTVPEQPAELNELQAEYVDGDLDRGEFESEVERVIDR